jgi:dissimilatory sulfite reductase (desulfoviridin) alpha/beta subunit
MQAISVEELNSLKSRAMMVEKGEGLFSVRIGVVGGRMDASHLKTIAELAAKCGNGQVHLTTRQGVEIPHVPYENLESLRNTLEQAGLRLALAGKCVRGITACPGTYCKFGQCDTQTLAQNLHDKVGGRDGLPHKFKIGIAGCRNGCTKPQENDLGIMGTAKGFVVFVGGKMGKKPRLGDQLPINFTTPSQLLSIVEDTLGWFIANGKVGERFGNTLDRLGLDCFVACIDNREK